VKATQTGLLYYRFKSWWAHQKWKYQPSGWYFFECYFK